MSDEKLDEVWFPPRVPEAVCHLNSGARGLGNMVQTQAEAKKVRCESNSICSQEMDAVAEEMLSGLASPAKREAINNNAKGN